MAKFGPGIDDADSAYVDLPRHKMVSAIIWQDSAIRRMQTKTAELLAEIKDLRDSKRTRIDC